MPILSRDIVSLTTARAQLSELADQVKAGAEKIITKNGEGYVALVDAHRLDYYHRLERAHIHLLMLDEAQRGLEDSTRRGDAASTGSEDASGQTPVIYLQIDKA